MVETVGIYAHFYAANCLTYIRVHLRGLTRFFYIFFYFLESD